MRKDACWYSKSKKIDTNGDVTCYVEKGDIEVSAELTDKDGLLGMFKDKPNYSDVKNQLRTIALI